jgi:sigma-B regulation protein RsbU (phosphoserine phosphatase)
MNENSGYKILAVDDSPVNLGIINSVLSREDYLVFTAENGPDARKAAEKEIPDLILLDIMMPGEDGFEVIRHLKSNPKTSGIPVIFLTGVSEIDSKVKGFNLGAVDYILKPFHPKEVLARVQIHLRLSAATNSLIKSQAQKLKQLKKAQKELLIRPDHLPEAKFGVNFNTLHEAGGDFYDVLPISKNIFGYCVADFSGHDISTSYLTASMKALLKQNCTHLFQPHESIKLINEVLVEILPEGKYLTSVYARLNRRSRQLTIISAAHPPALFIPHEGEAKFIKLDGDILGMFKDAVFGNRTISVNQKDRIFLYSDGLIEKSDKVWTKGLNALLEACEESRNHPISKAPEIIKELMFKNVTPPEDDVVIMGIEV